MDFRSSRTHELAATTNGSSKMALRNRHKWMAARLEVSLGVPSAEALAFCTRNVERLTAFLEDSDDRLFVFHQPPMKQVSVSPCAL